MGIVGEPDAELEDLLAEIEATQQAAFKPIRPGVNGIEIYAAAEPVLKKSKLHNHYEFLAHGMGLVSHEAPRLHQARRYHRSDADRARDLRQSRPRLESRRRVMVPEIDVAADR